MSENREDFVSFENALRNLKLRSEELRKLVSEGEIRAFRDGSSMKFRREDIDALEAKSRGEEEMAFADSLEDDTGMVTEQLSEEDTLLAEDVAEEKPARKAVVAPTRSRLASSSAAAAGAEDKEPGWVTATAILCTLILIWGVMVNYSVSKEGDPAGSFFTSAFANPKK